MRYNIIRITVSYDVYLHGRIQGVPPAQAPKGPDSLLHTLGVGTPLRGQRPSREISPCIRMNKYNINIILLECFAYTKSCFVPC